MKTFVSTTLTCIFCNASIDGIIKKLLSDKLELHHHKKRKHNE